MKLIFNTVQFLFLIQLLISSACNHVKPEPPERSALDSVMEVPTSVLNIPIEYDVENLQNWLNRKIYGTFVSQGLKINDDKDSLYLTVRKIAPIRMWWIKGVMWYELPVELSGTYFKKLGKLTITNPEPVVAQIVLKFNSEISLDENWNLVTKSDLHEVEWRKEPVLKLGKISFNLKRPLDSFLREKHDTLIYMMDQATYEHLDIKKVIDKLWNDIQKPLFIHKNSPEVYLKSRASAVEANLHKDNKKKLILDLMLFTQATMALEQEYLPPTNPDIPLYKVKSQDNTDFNIAIHGIISYKKINKEINNFLKNKEVEVKGYRAVFKELEIYGSGQSLVVKLETKGDLKGRLYILGELVYDPVKQVFSVVNFRYDLDTEDQLVKTAHSFLKEKILEEVQQYLTFDVSEHLSNLPEMISQAIDEGKSGDALDLTIDRLDVKEWSSLITGKDLQFVIQASGNAKIELKELKKGKSVKIGNIAAKY